MPSPKPKRATAAQRGYGHRWRKARERYLTEHPLCAMCTEQGAATAAMVIDHIEPHNGNPVLFWDESNWQALCVPHHNATKQREEKRGHAIGCDVNGEPLERGAHWRK